MNNEILGTLNYIMHYAKADDIPDQMEHIYDLAIENDLLDLAAAMDAADSVRFLDALVDYANGRGGWWSDRWEKHLRSCHFWGRALKEWKDIHDAMGEAEALSDSIFRSAGVEVDPDDKTHNYTQDQIDDFFADVDTMVIDFENKKATRVYPDANGVTDLGNLKIIH